MHTDPRLCRAGPARATLGEPPRYTPPAQGHGRAVPRDFSSLKGGGCGGHCPWLPLLSLALRRRESCSGPRGLSCSDPLESRPFTADSWARPSGHQRLSNTTHQAALSRQNPGLCSDAPSCYRKSSEELRRLHSSLSGDTLANATRTVQIDGFVVTFLTLCPNSTIGTPTVCLLRQSTSTCAQGGLRAWAA